MRRALFLAALALSVSAAAEECAKDDELCRLLVSKRPAIGVRFRSAVTVAAPTEIPCTPPGTSRAPCVPPDTYTSKDSPVPLNTPTSFGGTVTIGGQPYWRWIKKQDGAACSVAAANDHAAYQYACAAKIGDVLLVTMAFRVP